MLDKLALNNEILSNKKKVDQAKVNVINKLVKKTRKLKMLSTKKNNDPKIEAKIKRIAEEIAHIKKLKNVEVLKKAILCDQNPAVIITNGRSMPEEIAEALLFSEKNVTCVVAKLKSSFNLNDESNPYWRQNFQELSKKQIKIQKIAYKQERRQQKKLGNTLEKKRQEWVEENLLKTNQEDENKSLQNDIDNSLISTEQLKDAVKVKIPSGNSSKNKYNEFKNKEQISVNSKFSKDADIYSKSKKKSKNEHISNGSDRKNIVKVSKTLDPFFVTDTGENYMSSVVIDRIQLETPNDGLVRKERRALNGPNDNFKTKKDNLFSSSKMQKLDVDAKESISKSSNLLSDNIHPSWAAKQKQKGFRELCNKKIIFNEDSVKDIEINTKITKESEIKNDVHPSWKAKQNMKPTIKEFRGKKTTFDFDS